MKYGFVYVLSLSLFAICLGTSQAKAWSAFGHLTVCDLAYRNTTETTRERLDELFQVDKGGILVRDKDGDVDRWYTSFNIGCLEEDEWPRKHPKDHFLNISRDTKSIKSGSCPGTASCIFEGIQRDLGILADATKSNEERVFALMAVGHWVGDLHQPLHVSFKDDQGGNHILVALSGTCGSAPKAKKTKPRNLHAVWDRCLLDSGLFERVRLSSTFREGWSDNTITYRAVDLLQDGTTLEEELEIVQGTPSNWANESFEITLLPGVEYCKVNGVFCNYSSSKATYKKGDKKRKVWLKQAYLRQFEDLASERIRFAGLRLAHLINSALDPNYTVPIQNSSQLEN